VKKAQIQIGHTYRAKVSGKLADVRITGESRYGGWDGVNVATGRTVRIKGAARLRYETGMVERVRRALEEIGNL